MFKKISCLIVVFSLLLVSSCSDPKEELSLAMDNLKQMYMVMFEYDLDHGNYPDDVSELVAANLVDSEWLEAINTCEIKGKKFEFIYRPGFSSKDSSDVILMHTSAPIDGRRVYLRNDGAVMTVEDAKFQELLSNQ